MKVFRILKVMNYQNKLRKSNIKHQIAKILSKLIIIF